MKLFILFALLLFAACDTSTLLEEPVQEEEPPYQCPVEVSDQSLDFFPLKVGNSWEYAYESSSHHSITTYREAGTLTWTLFHIECAEQNAYFSLQENRMGIGLHWNAYEQAWDSLKVRDSRRLVLIEDSLGKVHLPYGRSSFNRYHSIEKDSVVVAAGPLMNLFSGPVRACSTHGSQVVLNRHVGLTFYDGGCGRASHYLSLKLALLRFIPSANANSKHRAKL